MQIKGVIFDFDGTIADTWWIGNAAFKATFLKFTQRELSDEELMVHAGFTEDIIVSRLIPGSADQAAEFFFNEFARGHVTCRAPFDGIVPLLNELKVRGSRLAIVTGKGPRAAEISFSEVHVTHLFEEVQTAVPGDTRKTPRIVDLARRWMLKPSEVAYLGDTVSDMLQAIEAGVVPLGAAWGGAGTASDLAGAGATAVFNRPSDLLDWLDGDLPHRTGQGARL